MGYYKLNTDGTVQSANTQIDTTWLDLSSLTTKEDGSYYTYYNQDGTADLIKEAEANSTALLNSFKDAIQAKLDTKAQEAGYDNIVSATSYAGYPNEFQGEALTFGTWRSAVWAYGYTELAKIQAGERAVPTVEEFISELPER